jgi:N-acetylmuramoyl-L-alanine amidase
MGRSVRSLLLSFILCCSAVPAISQQRGPELLAILDSRDSVAVAVFDSNGVRYLDVQQVLTLLRLPAIFNDTTHKMEFLSGPNLVRLTHRNPFVVITERATANAVVYQMQTFALKRHGRFILPVDAFADLFDRVWSGGLTVKAEEGLLLLSSKRTEPYDITGLQIERRVNGYLLTVLASRKLGDVEAWLKSDGWLFVTIAGARADTVALQSFRPSGAVRELLVFQSPTAVQLTFLVSTDVEQAEVAHDPGSPNLLLSLRTRSTVSPDRIPKKPTRATERSLAEQRRHWKLDVIVIDPGHGGKDPGALGVTRTREKDITLAVGLRLGRLIEESMKDVKVVYTRKTDKFIELYRRTQIANEAGGKLFVSIHCNSVDRKPSRQNGFEIYLLAPGKTEEAVTAASRENAVIQFETGYKDRYKELTEEEFIMITMAQSAYMKYSEQFAELAAATMAKQLKIRNSGVKQAGFYVLVGASMPNVLIEVGYLSNKAEEQILRSANGQEKIADAIFKGIKDYKAQYERALTP